MTFAERYPHYEGPRDGKRGREHDEGAGYGSHRMTYGRKR